MNEDEHGNMETLGDMKPAPLTSPSTHPPLLCLRIALAEAHFKVTKIWTLKSWFSQTFFESGPKPKKNIERHRKTFMLCNFHHPFQQTSEISSCHGCCSARRRASAASASPSSVATARHWAQTSALRSRRSWRRGNRVRCFKVFWRTFTTDIRRSISRKHSNHSRNLTV